MECCASYEQPPAPDAGPGSESLNEGVDGNPVRVFLCEIPELLRDVAERDHPVIEGEVPEQDRARLHDVHVVLEEPFLIHVRFVDLALGTVFFDEPVVAKRLRVLVARNPYELGGLRFEALQSPWTDLQMRVQFKVAHGSLLHTVLGMRLARTIRMTLWPKSAVGPNMSGQPPSI